MKEDPLTALQRHFEEQYGKLDIPGVKSKKRKRRQVEETQKDDSWVSSDEEWNGIESTVNVQPEPSPRVISFTDSVQVVSFTDSVQAAEEDDPKSYKSFMSSKPPKPAAVQKKVQAAPATSPDDEALNLQNDIALQRLLRESNLLSAHASREDPGRLHHLTLDARISHLGGKEAVKGNVPHRIRKGIETTRKEKQAKTEREAQEAGILMPVKRQAKPQKARERGLRTTSGVGKFKNGMLKINEREIRRVNNSQGGPRRGKSVKKLFK